jgi:O-6-methylguanine DNA methyltransferase
MAERAKASETARAKAPAKAAAGAPATRVAATSKGQETIHWSEFDTPVGTMRIASSERGVVYLELPRENGRGFRGWMKRHAPKAALVEAFEPNREYIAQVSQYLDGKRREFDLPIDMRATEFQCEVYDVLCSIEYGELRSYGDVARAVGRPKAVRAVGAANGSNPIALIVPCHRVIASNGQLHGYGGGLELKAHLLAMEQSLPNTAQGQLF